LIIINHTVILLLYPIILYSLIMFLILSTLKIEETIQSLIILGFYEL